MTMRRSKREKAARFLWRAAYHFKIRWRAVLEKAPADPNISDGVRRQLDVTAT